MPAPEVIHRLVEQFRRNYHTYKSDAYNEAQLRQEFLNPFFEALGWDVANQKGWALQYREVIHEDKVEIDGSKKAPDYAFRIGGVRKFFVEAKKPAENIETDASLAYQLRRYAWNAHLPLSILTDFEEFAVYDCRNKPHPNDSPATSRIMMMGFEEYLTRWDEISEIFSHDAIVKGDFDRFAEDNTGKRGTTKVDDAFLADIEEWRLALARNIALRNPQVEDERQLNFAVQMTIDRIIFLRICEDRQIEEKDQLLEISQSPDIYAQLIDLFYRADLRYNSGLFHFKTEKRQNSEIDSLSPTLLIDDKVLKAIIKDLYYPSPYIFNEIPVEILGQVYEQFLGKVIRLTTGHRAKVEEKPEVRKAGGVYYTPKYIVDYIVENTVGELVKDRTPKQVAKLSIVDPACGSGSFLLGAYQYLLDWHERWYLEHSPEDWAKGDGAALSPAADGGWRISTDEKKRILLNNIYGVDIDPQAVEVTKLSLLLKVLEGETGQLSLGFERVLPDLGANIQCGNSLIGPDYYDGKQIGLFDREEMFRINAFDWQRAFPTIFAQGGFDAVIGNPPYISMENMENIHRDYYYGSQNGKRNYITAVNKANVYSIFWEKAMIIANHNGYIGFITPYSWMTNSSFIELRKLFFTKRLFHLILLPQGVFKDAGIRTCVFTIQNQKPKKNIKLSIQDLRRYSIDQIPGLISLQTEKYKIEITEERIMGEEIINISKGNNKIELLSKLDKLSSPLNSLIKIDRGCDTANNNKYTGDYFDLKLNPKPLLEGRNFWRYGYQWEGLFLYYLPEKMKKDKPTARPGENERFDVQEKLILYRFVNENHGFICAYDNQQFYCLGSTYILRLHDENPLSLKFLLGILNSKLISFVNKNLFKGVKVTLSELGRIPIHKLNNLNEGENRIHDLIIEKVDNIIDLFKLKPTRTIPNEFSQLDRQIAATDAEIDRLVYELYGLTDEEIRIVEESVG